MLSLPPLFTDFYQLTMAYGYWKLNRCEQQAVFHLVFRNAPCQGNYAVACGLEAVVAFLKQWRFMPDDITYLASLRYESGEVIFPEDFLNYLASLRFSCDLSAIPEGTIVFPHEPLLRIQGPLLQCQLLESALLNIINFQTLIATKASRICMAAHGDPVIEFGMRRAQGPDGALSASRAAYIGGCVAVSNTMAGQYYKLPVRGTHAHSWVSAFPSEKEAFEAYASVLPHNCILLVDTYDTIQGVKHAIEIGRVLRQQGADLLGIRLDSGDMVELSIKARTMLDAAGFNQTHIVASNTLDEYAIADLKKRGAKISMWGVGTHLVTSYDYPALDGVYKLSAIQDQAGCWQPTIKLSEEELKISNPGRHQVRRFFYGDQYAGDVIYDIDLGMDDVPEIVTQNGVLHPIKMDDYDAYADLLQPIFKQGKYVMVEESIHLMRKRALEEAARFYRTYQSESYRVGLEKKCDALKKSLVKKLVSEKQ